MASGFLTIPSALIQANGLQILSLAELRLFWRLVDELSVDDLSEEGHGITVRVPAADLWEPGEKDSFRLIERLEAVSGITLKLNLDGRDGHDLWRMKLSLLPEYEVREDWIEMSVGPRMYAAIRERKTFTTIREAVLFSMRGSKYSAILYSLIRDKAGQKMPEWEVDLPVFRTVMQVSEKSYPRFGDFRTYVIKPAVAEVSEKSEYIITIEKGRTHKNQVRSLVVRWSLKDRQTAQKTAKEAMRHSKRQAAADAPPLIPQEPVQMDLDDPSRAFRWRDTLLREEWTAIASKYAKGPCGGFRAGNDASLWLDAWNGEGRPDPDCRKSDPSRPG